MYEHTPDHEIDERVARLLGAAEPGDAAIMSDRAVRRLVGMLDEIDPGDQLEAPPASVWDAIAAATGQAGGDTAGAGAPAVGSVAPAQTPAPTDLSERRARRTQTPPVWLAAAAAVLAVMVVAVGALSIASLGGDDAPAGTEIAAAELDVLVSSWTDLGASATLRQLDTDDEIVLDLDVAGLQEVDGFFEVWLLTPEVDGLVSLGPLRSDGRYQVPPGIDPARFSVVDVSIEPHDGDPTHSGNSILRGPLSEA
ncbi:MAG: anti-sigma factor [Acidimicrobiales bacterium]